MEGRPPGVGVGGWERDVCIGKAGKSFINWKILTFRGHYIVIFAYNKTT